MIVCHCHGVTDKAIRALVEDGARPCDIRNACVAGSRCGNCCPLIDDIASETLDHGETAGLSLAPAR